MKTIDRILIAVAVVAVIGFLAALLVRACGDRRELTPITASVR